MFFCIRIYMKHFACGEDCLFKIKVQREEVGEPASSGFILQGEREKERRKWSSAQSLQTVFILTTRIDHSSPALP